MKKKSASSVLIGLFVLAFAVYSSPARAGTTTWTGNGDGGDWFDDDNWSNGKPDCADDAFINNDGKADILLPGAIAGALALGENVADSGTVSVDGTYDGELSIGTSASCEAPLIPATLYVGNAGSGTLNIINGGKVDSGNGHIAFSPGEGEAPVASNGTVTVDGENSDWEVNGRLWIGAIPFSSTDGGTALVNVTNGGTITVLNNTENPTGVYMGTSGTLTGNGTLKVLDNIYRLAVVAGTLAPIETLTINGNLHLESTATTLCTVTPTVSDMVEVSGVSAGEARLDGHLIVILSGTFYPGLDCTATFTLLHANGGRTDMFDSVSILGRPTNANYTAAITYDTNNAYLVLTFTNCDP